MAHVPLAALEVGKVVTAHLKWPWEDTEVTETGPITKIVDQGTARTVTVNGVDFFALPTPPPAWFTNYDPPAFLGDLVAPPDRGDPDVVPPPEDNPSPIPAAAAPAPEEEDVVSSLEPSPSPVRDLYPEPAETENPGPKSAPPTPQRPPKKQGGSRSRKRRTPRRKATTGRKSTYRVSRRR